MSLLASKQSARNQSSASGESPPVSPAAIQVFDFHGDRLDVVSTPEGHFVVLARLCAPFSLDVKTQADKLKGLPWAGWGIFPAPSSGGIQDTFCLDIRSVAGWLFTLNGGKIAAHLREKLALYQRECADVLADHFLGARRATSPALDASSLVAALDKVLAPLAAALAAQNDRLAAIEIRQRESGVLAPERVNAIKARAASCASDLAKFGIEKRRAASLRIHKRLKMRVGWYGDRCRLDNMPARHEADVLRELEIVEHETRGAVGSARQRTLFAVPANVNRARPSA